VRRRKENTRRWHIIVLIGFCLSANQVPACAQLKPIRGKASYYANSLHGRYMLNGERYHRDSMTCAHLTLPFGTTLKVRNLRNNRVVYVKVTDRGPFVKSRIIDLSYAAAKQLRMLSAGVAKVEITPYLPERVPFRFSDEILLPKPKWQEEADDETDL